MKDGGWVGQFVNGHRYERVFPPTPSDRPAVDAAPPRPVLYDAQGKPLTRERTVGFVKTT